MEPTTHPQFTKYLKLYKAILNGNWPVAERIFNSDRLALTAPISSQLDMAVHVAAGTGLNMHFLQKLVERMTETQLETLNSSHMTALDLASAAGNTEAVRILHSRCPRLILSRNLELDPPLVRAAQHGHEETVRFLLTETERLDPDRFNGDDGFNIVHSLIQADLYDIAHYVLEKYPNLYLHVLVIGTSAFHVLDMLAKRPQAFPNGSQLGYWRRLVYQRKTIQAGSVEMSGRRNTKLMHKHTMEIVGRIFDKTRELTDRDFTPESFFKSPLLSAAKLGIHEIVTMIIKDYPYLIYLCDDDQRSVIHLAVLHRQEKVFNLWYQMSLQKHSVTRILDVDFNNILHLAGKLAPSKTTSGAALQMQRDLQWFKEVEKIVPPSFRIKENFEGKTPRMVFTEEHRKLVKKGEEWMKGTASSCTVVGALVATVVFASAFTVPGGNHSDKGIPIFLNHLSFMVFAISDAVALFSSSTSVVMFLAMLISRYEEEDFLGSLPRKLSIGLISLFISITSMVIAFSASLYIVLSHRSEFFLIPIVLLAALPTILFARLHFPLLVEIVLSTFGPSIFGPQGKEIIF